MFIALALVGPVTSFVSSAWRRHRLKVATRRDLQSLDARALRDLGLSHRASMESSLVQPQRWCDEKPMSRPVNVRGDIHP